MAETITELCYAEARLELIEIRDGLPKLITDKKELEDKWGVLPAGEACRHLKTDLVVLRHLDASIGIADNPIGTYGNLKELLDVLIELDLGRSES